MELRTRRLVLRTPDRPGDVEALFGILSHAAVRDSLAHVPMDIEATRQRIASMSRLSDDERFKVLLVFDFDGEVVGEIRAWNIGDEIQATSADPREVWIGYALHPDRQGHGFAIEAVEALVGWLRQRGTATVFANLREDNAASKRLLDRLGFTVVLYMPPEMDRTGRNQASIRMALSLS